MENVTKNQVNVPCGKTLEKILIYTKFMKGLLTRKHKYGENIALT